MKYKEEIVKKIIAISGKYSPYQVFKDWCEMYAISIQNACVWVKDDIYQEREKTFNTIFSKYKENEQELFRDITALYPIALGHDMTDVLGEIYMESGSGSKMTGQFFTPFKVSEAVAELNEEKFKKDGIIKLYEPTVGSGGMIIASVKLMQKMNIDYQNRLKVICQDLDWLPVYMSYIQISMLGVDAIVFQGDALTDTLDSVDKRCIFRTPKNLGAI